MSNGVCCPRVGVWGKVTKNDNLETQMRIEKEEQRYHKEDSDFGGHCSIVKKVSQMQVRKGGIETE